MSEIGHSGTRYSSRDKSKRVMMNSMAEAAGEYEYTTLKQQPIPEFGSNGEVSNRIDQSDGMVNQFSDNPNSLYDETTFTGDTTSQAGLTEQTSWQSSGYISMSDEGLRQNGDILHDHHDHHLMALHSQDGLGYVQPFDMSASMVGGYVPDTHELLHQKMLDVSQQDVLPSHSMQMPLETNVIPDPPRRMLSKGRKNKDEANELVRRAKLLPKVMGVRYDANHQYWVATWYQNRKRMDRYFSVGRFGFEEARLLAIDCRKTAGKSLQGKSYDRPSYSKEGKSRSYDSVEKHSDYYNSEDMNKKSKDFNRLNVSKVALNYILSDLCNNCLPTILENNHMPGELYIHCYNKISDHLQMIITASQSEDIEKYLHLFQLCIQNRVLPSALQVQEQRAMITTLCQM
ncbi:uncharacterized protein TA09965 [Theileria annulata]|uniref:AP2 domain/AP2-coincident C-terminal, putative n=1 Tax=Theileria annulata TaxID=5874 RepID=Q4U8Q5_THEAN|nr:uncharacterized protein TA09965 [Theileria annulata]CAI76798.1 hypothetical protein TA09965 [Theileria annulata]|eukprot:XP_953423.1 hypothetical protein TA09965 [Theileria annulata]